MDVHASCSVTAQSFTKTGQRHIKAGLPCEDVAVMIEKETYRFYGLADGQSGKRYGRLGGQAVLTAVSAYLEEKGIGALSRHTYTDEIQYELMRVIRQTLSALSEAYGAAAGDFASTVIAAAVDLTTKEYMLLHLGDGAVVAVKDGKTPLMVSTPDNGITRRYTTLTSSANALHHLRIKKGVTDDIDRLVLVSDGTTMLCRGETITKRAELLFCDLRDRSAILKAVQSGAPQDDAGCIVIDFCG